MNVWIKIFKSGQLKITIVSGGDINSKVLAFAFGLSAEIERNLISQRTKEALARKKAKGVVIGRPKGKKSSKTKLTGQEQKIKELLSKKVSYSAFGRILGVHSLNLSDFVKSEINHWISYFSRKIKIVKDKEFQMNISKNIILFS